MAELSAQSLPNEIVQNLLEASADSVVIIDRSHAIIFVNSQVHSLLGYQREELIGQPVHMLLPERIRDAHVAMVDGFLAAPRVQPMGLGRDLFARHKSNREVPIDIALTPIDVAGELLVAAAIRDSSYRKKTEEQLRNYANELMRSNHDLQVFAYAASHDLNAPLRRVRQLAKLLEAHSKESLDDTAIRYMDYIVAETERMQALIQSLLAYSQLEQHSGEFKATALGELVDEVISRLEPLISEQDAQVSRGELPTLAVDATRIEQLFQNLVENAIKYRSDLPPVIDISAELVDDFWVFKVRDNGMGIDPEQKDQAFALFTRLTADSAPGSGIGLATCKRIVEHHGGKIWVDSKPGAGSTFCFSLPAPAARQA